MGLQNLGAPVSDNADLVYEDYIDVVKAADLTTGEIDTRINSGLSGYATDSYVDAQDALNANQAYVDAGDATRVRLTQKDVNNGVPGLDTTGRVSINRINLPTTQKYNAGPWSPPSYPGATALTTEVTLTTCPITDPGFPYKVIVHGQIDSRISVASEYPVITVRQGSTAGPVVASGAGVADIYQALGYDTFNRTTSYAQGLGSPDWTQGATPGFSDATDGAISCNGADAYWNITTVGQVSKMILARRTNPLDAITLTDYQMIWITLGSIGYEPGFGAETGQTCVFGRINSAGTQFVRAGINAPGTAENQVFLAYSTGSGEIPAGSVFFGAFGVGDQLGLECGTIDGSNPYAYSVYKKDTGGTIQGLLGVNDTSHNTLVGPSNRGWGFGLYAASRNPSGGGQPPRRPMSITEARIEPTLVTPPSAPVRIVSTDIALQSAITGATTLYVRAARSGSAATVNTSAFMPKLHVMVVPA